MKILIAEDDASIAQALTAALRAAGHVIDVVHRGDEALWLAEEQEPDLLILDVQMPGLDGLTVCSRLRAAGSGVPILMLTGRGRVADRVAGLDAGADDYLAKPFEVEELLARVRALSRRPRALPRAVLRAGDLEIDLAARTLTKGEARVDLTAKEFAVLETLVRSADDVVTRERLLASAWDFAFDPSSNVVDAYIRLLRKKIDDDGDVSRIETVRGVGYRLRTAT